MDQRSRNARDHHRRYPRKRQQHPHRRAARLFRYELVLTLSGDAIGDYIDAGDATGRSLPCPSQPYGACSALSCESICSAGALSEHGASARTSIWYGTYSNMPALSKARKGAQLA